jgi:hypothetical protein
MNLGSVSYFTIDDFVKYKYVEKYGQPEKQDIWVTYDIVASSTSATAVRIPPSSEEELFITPEIEEQIKDFETTVASIDIGETYVTIRMS